MKKQKIEKRHSLCEASDQEHRDIEKAKAYLVSFIRESPMYGENTVYWTKAYCSAMMAIIVESYKKSNLNYNDFCEYMHFACSHYKSWFKEGK